MALQEKNYDPALMAGASSDVTAAQTLTAASSQAFAVGANGATNPVLEIDTNTASVATGINVTGAAEAGGVAVKVISSGTNEALTLNAKGSGTITIAGVSTGNVQVGGASSNPAFIVDSTSANALAVGPAGTTSPTLKVNANTSSAVTGLEITGSATGTATAVAAIGSAADEHLTIDAKAAGTLGLGTVSTGLVSIAMASSSAGLAYKRRVLASSGNTTMTSAMSGSIMLIDGATVAYTLPAIGAGDVGMEFWFATTVASTGATVTAGAADLLTGGVMIMSSGAGIESDQFQPNVTSDLILTMNGTTKGGMIGSTLHYIAVSATRWYVDGTLLGSGTIVTPFS